MTGLKQISIPEDMYARIAKMLPMTSFRAVDDFVVDLLKKTLDTGDKPGEYTQEDEEKVKERLRSLGYIE